MRALAIVDLSSRQIHIDGYAQCHRHSPDPSDFFGWYEAAKQHSPCFALRGSLAGPRSVIRRHGLSCGTLSGRRVRSDSIPPVGSWQLLGKTPIDSAGPNGRLSRSCLGSKLVVDRPEHPCTPGPGLGEHETTLWFSAAAVQALLG